MAVEIIARADKCQTECNNSGGGESAFNTAHGKIEAKERQAKNPPSIPC